MRQVVVTGYGIISSLGNNIDEVVHSLQSSSSGISINETNKSMGLRSHISGSITNLDLKESIDRKLYRFMGDAAAYAFLSTKEAIDHANLSDQILNDYRTGIIMGSGGASSEDQIDSADILRSKGLKRIGPYRVTKAMGSTVSACLATSFGIKGINYSISSACATSAHCLGAGMEQIQLDKQDVIIAGGGEAEHWGMTSLFDAMGALSTKYNETPEKASRAFDRDRDGFVIAGGGGAIILEEKEHAISRGAKILAELTGYAATSDGQDMVSPSGEGGKRCMEIAWNMCGKRKIDYINAHGTSTPAGDITELNAIKEVFKQEIPLISSTKSLSGHSLGAAGVQESIYTLLMMDNDFIAGSANIENLDEEAKEFPIVQENKPIKLKRALSNSFGFGGTNASLIFEKA
ncbi:MAG: beta-ketoacyl-[acyl-carrier-protein] synthase I [Gammaproteobacteria bacterium]|jgi:3-oxoacyl-[acyl-carrier-protein] synthase-1|nr:beta-ketoacyl-[acyl-carrier-protein] synthase I [Gammaproteobacteria bacterium]HJL95918.1 beta-ketoacyl synthase N-terminal-like domain-containing protein [SAR86 cluster bacterium]|tara:strand:- start:33421 stop:34635 length:1215 start_codon:yes stop_codon:yes gene_type:complete